MCRGSMRQRDSVSNEGLQGIDMVRGRDRRGSFESFAADAIPNLVNRIKFGRLVTVFGLQNTHRLQVGTQDRIGGRATISKLTLS
jgi:hypothetical protein